MSSRSRTITRIIFWAFAASFVLFAVATIATIRPGDPAIYPPKANAASIDIYVISHGYHSGITVPHDAMRNVANDHGLSALMALSTHFPGYSFIELGWGEEQFYRNVRSTADVTLPLAVRALFWPDNSSVIHAVGLVLPPERAFVFSEIVRLSLSEDGFARLLKTVNASFKPQASGLPVQALGQGIYGPSVFYRAEGSFHLTRVCNHWVVDALNAAGIPTAPLIATHPIGLLWDLRLRGGGIAVSAQRGA